MNLFFDNFPILTEAPNGVKKLRELILQLAVMGKLVPQDPHDEPASVLLDKIKEEKERLIKEGKIKKTNPLPPITESEIPYPLPTGWEWTRLEHICSYIQRGRSPKYSDIKKIPVIAQKCIQWHGFEMYKAKFIDPDTINRYEEERFVKKGDMLLNSTGVGTLGRIIIYEKEFNPYSVAVVDSHVSIIRLFRKEIIPYFLFLWFSGPKVQNEINHISTGSTKQTELNINKIRNYIIPLPPVGEQKRIVAKVDRLMELCESLEEQEEKSRKKQVSMNNACLHQLLSTSEPQEFEKNRRRIADNFHLLYDIPENVSGLKQAILQLAVMGKLVPQDPRDEPASILLDKIKTEKEQLIKEGKIKKLRPATPITEEEIPFNLPFNWQWVKFDHIKKNKDNALKAGPFGSSLKKDSYVKDGYKIYGQEQVINNDPYFGDYFISEEKFKQLKSCSIEPGDILISLVGTIGKVLILPSDCQDGIINPRLIKLSLNESIDRRFIKIFLSSPCATGRLSSFSRGSTMNILNLGIIKRIPIPIPPVCEQRRIVAKVDRLMELCESLEENLKKSESKSEKLFNAVVNQLSNR